MLLALGQAPQVRNSWLQGTRLSASWSSALCVASCRTTLRNSCLRIACTPSYLIRACLGCGSCRLHHAAAPISLLGHICYLNPPLESMHKMTGRICTNRGHSHSYQLGHPLREHNQACRPAARCPDLWAWAHKKPCALRFNPNFHAAHCMQVAHMCSVFLIWRAPGLWAYAGTALG